MTSAFPSSCYSSNSFTSSFCCSSLTLFIPSSTFPSPPAYSYYLYSSHFLSSLSFPTLPPPPLPLPLLCQDDRRPLSTKAPFSSVLREIRGITSANDDREGYPPKTKNLLPENAFTAFPIISDQR